MFNANETNTSEKIKVKNYFMSKSEKELALKMSEVVANNINRNDFEDIDNQLLA